ncbi:hypothetical protein GALL_481570 [mine drainage metagenome]|uniref:Uncharacterized protein n=1 Tax=mine drainage metagenome TaxID=410659 RepID=A0A1J5PHH1_9ZZZZ
MVGELAQYFSAEDGLVHGHAIGKQARIASRVLARNHGAGFDACMLRQCRFDFAEFDAKAAYFYLRIDAADVVELAVRPPAHQVAGAVQTRVRRAEGVGNETFGRAFRLLEVAGGQAAAAYIQFTDKAGRQ